MARAVSNGGLEGAGFEPFVPDGQAVAAIPVEDLDAVAVSVEEEEEVSGGGGLTKGVGDDAGEAVKEWLFRAITLIVQNDLVKVVNKTRDLAPCLRK